MPTIHSLFSDDEDEEEEKANPDPGKANYYEDPRIGEGSGEEVEGIVV